MSVPTDDIMTSDEFELAFGKSAVGDPPADDPPADAPPADDPPAADPPAGDDPPAKTPEEVKAEEDAAKVKAEEARKAEIDKAVADRLAAEQKKTEDARKAEEARVAAEAKKAEDAKKLAPTEEDKKLLDDVAKDFPDVAKALDVHKRLLKAEFDTQLETLKAEMQKNLEPLATASQTVAKNAYEAQILGKHPDAFEKMNDLSAWIDTQPPLLKRAYDAVLDTPGTPAADVIALFDLWKEATKAPEQDAAAEAEKARLAAEKQKKLDAQEGVRSKRTPSGKDAAPLDFDSAFATVQ